MSAATTIGLEIAKSVFRVHGTLAVNRFGPAVIGTAVTGRTHGTCRTKELGSLQRERPTFMARSEGESSTRCGLPDEEAYLGAERRWRRIPQRPRSAKSRVIAWGLFPAEHDDCKKDRKGPDDND